jgi:hypothetical protein
MVVSHFGKKQLLTVILSEAKNLAFPFMDARDSSFAALSQNGHNSHKVLVFHLGLR